MRRIEFKRGMIFSAALLLQCVAYGQIPNGERPKMVKAIGAFDIRGMFLDSVCLGGIAYV